MHHLVFILSGFAVVMSTLALLWGAMAAIGHLFIARADAAARTAKAPAAVPDRPKAPAPATDAPNASGVPAHHLAAIAAAVAAMTGGRGHVTRVTAMPHRSQAWQQQGRTEQFASHRVRWDWAVPGPPHIDAPRHSHSAPTQIPGSEVKP